MQQPAPDDQPAHLYYTSGTTGRPKGVILTHRNVTTHAIAAIAEFQLSDTDVWFHVAPMFHLADAWATFAITLVGGRHVMLPAFESAKVMTLLEREKITLSNLIPTMLNMIVNHEDARKYNYSSLRVILSGGAPIAPETVRQVMDIFGCDYIQTYGLTETSPYVTISKLKAHLASLPEEEQRSIISRTGREFLSVTLKVVDETGNEVPWDDATVGEVWVKGDTVSPGYWNRPEETAQAFQNGWLKTGDLAVVDLEGYINIVDRKKDMIVTGGENVFSNEVEYILYEHPAVLECAIIGVPDEKWGEAVRGVIVKRPDLDATEEGLIAFVKERIAHYKAPKRIDFVEELPKTGSGKIMKREIRDRYWKDRDRLIQ
jgi:acyl-CoA synthetase (AMP-forming)/AMP-acid ligase II